MSSQESHQQYPASSEAGVAGYAIEQDVRNQSTPEGHVAQRLTSTRVQFLALWIVSGANYFGYAMMQLTLVLLATHLTRSPILVSVVSFAQIFPAFLLGLFAGAMGDRYNRRRILLLATTLRLSALALALLAA